MDEITLFAELKPSPPEDTADMRARTRVRLDSVLGTDESVSRRPRRRRLALGLAAVAVVACAATVIPSVLLGGGGGAPAYAVTRNADGSVNVTISNIADAADGAGLQQALRAEGIRALVWAGTDDQTPPDNPFCQAPASNLEPRAVQQAVVHSYPADVPAGGITMVLTGTADKDPGGVGFIIYPASMPKGSVLYFSREFQPVMAIEKNGHGHVIAKDSGQSIPPPEVLRHARLPC